MYIIPTVQQMRKSFMTVWWSIEWRLILSCCTAIIYPDNIWFTCGTGSQFIEQLFQNKIPPESMLSVNLIFLYDIMSHLGNHFWGQHDETGVKSILFWRKWFCINNDTGRNGWSCSENLPIDFQNDKEYINNQCDLLNNFWVLQAIRCGDSPLETEILNKTRVTIFLQVL